MPAQPFAPIIELERLVAEITLIHALRADEGASVTINCPNPEGPPNEAVEVCDDWTAYTWRRFEGATLLEALQAAMTARKAATGEEV